MMRWSICLCAVLFAASCATSDGGPGTESPGGGSGGVGGEGGSAGDLGNAGASGTGAGAGGVSGAAGANPQAGAGGMSGSSGEGGSGGVAGDVAGGAGGSVPNDDDAGTDDAGSDDEGYCTVACTGIAPDEGVAEACGMILSRDECTMFDTGGFPPNCRWVTPDSEPCLAP